MASDTSQSFRITDPLSFGKLDDKLTTADVYTGKTAEASLNTVGLGLTLDDTSLSGYLNIPALGKPLLAPGSLLDKLKVNKDSLTSGILAANSALKNAISTINQAKSAVDGIKKDVLSEVSALKSQVTATVNGVTSAINGAALGSIQGISSAIGSIAGSALPVAFKDVSGLSSLSTQLLKEANAIGIPSAFTSFAKGIGNDSILNQVTKNLLPDVAKLSNVNMLQQIAGSAVASRVQSLVPDFTKKFASSYVYKGINSIAHKAETCSKIMTSLAKIDEKLFNKTVNGNYTPSADLACYASDDLKDLMKAESTVATTGFSFKRTDAFSIPDNSSIMNVSDFLKSDVVVTSTDDSGNPLTKSGKDEFGNIVKVDFGQASVAEVTVEKAYSTPVVEGGRGDNAPRVKPVQTGKETISLTGRADISYYRKKVYGTASRTGYKEERTVTEDNESCVITYKTLPGSTITTITAVIDHDLTNSSDALAVRNGVADVNSRGPSNPEGIRANDSGLSTVTEIRDGRTATASVSNSYSFTDTSSIPTTTTLTPVTTVDPNIQYDNSGFSSASQLNSVLSDASAEASSKGDSFW